MIDLVTMKMLTFPQGKEGNEIDRTEIPDELADDAELWRERLLESALRLQRRADGARAGRRSRFPKR